MWDNGPGQPSLPQPRHEPTGEHGLSSVLLGHVEFLHALRITQFNPQWLVSLLELHTHPAVWPHYKPVRHRFSLLDLHNWAHAIPPSLEAVTDTWNVFWDYASQSCNPSQSCRLALPSARGGAHQTAHRSGEAMLRT
ncbi:hypothetical protein IF1G_06753 [Cordyceps javanica]|uniref:Uncharacterized protein n=1 Tax=Cordyceps javanica TaxID=43265 RepID=A0A545UZ41_9HYPO|nr:hypothetical protein IF1G_06753 [Cordyceps javanica]